LSEPGIRHHRLESFSSPTKEQVDDNQRKDQADATAVVSDSGTHVVAATAKEKYQDDENHYERHGRKFSMDALQRFLGTAANSPG
jgi:hypothetical protein